MTIAVTGASGFIGMELLDVLNKREDVSIVALTRGSVKEASADCCIWRSTDYSYESLRDIFRGTGADGRVSEPVDAVIHLAGVRGTENDPDKFAVNLAMTDNILKAMTASGTRRIVFASTMSVYNEDSLMPWKEDAPLKGRSCYGDSKADCEQLIRSYESAYRGTAAPISYGIARIAQVVGEGEKRRGMMNVFLDTARDHGTIRVMGRSVLKKQYIYVKDLVNVLAMLATDCGGNITVNAGMRDAYSNLEVARIVNEVFGNPAPVDYDDSYPEKGRPFLMDTCRLRNELGYEPLDMKDAIIRLRDNI